MKMNSSARREVEGRPSAGTRDGSASPARLRPREPLPEGMKRALDTGIDDRLLAGRPPVRTS